MNIKSYSTLGRELENTEFRRVPPFAFLRESLSDVFSKKPSTFSAPPLYGKLEPLTPGSEGEKEAGRPLAGFFFLKCRFPSNGYTVRLFSGGTQGGQVALEGFEPAGIGLNLIRVGRGPGGGVEVQEGRPRRS